MKVALTLLVAVLCMRSAYLEAGEPAPASVDKKIAPVTTYKTLKLGFIGRARAYPRELKVVFALAKDPQAEACFLKLAENANSCAALYGLVGLKVIKSKKFDEVKAALEKRKDKVQTTQGCYSTSHTVKEMVDAVIKANIPAPPKK